MARAGGPRITTTLRVDAALLDRLDRVAEQTDRSRNQVIVQACRQFVSATDEGDD